MMYQQLHQPAVNALKACCRQLTKADNRTIKPLIVKIYSRLP